MAAEQDVIAKLMQPEGLDSLVIGWKDDSSHESREVTPVSKEEIDKLAAAWLSTLQPTLVGLQHKIVQLIDKQSAIADDLEKQNSLVSHVTDNVSLQGLEVSVGCECPRKYPSEAAAIHPAPCIVRHLLRQPCLVHCETPVETTLPCALRDTC
ncbi:unnamed protein product [Timema podura]|uniref:Uncharacterized protein n=1 Tax=Timema podura TaxID=61482 RepID=A0ABN7P0V6_TIMPD|nr:unnamed protein product [Timema podura]